METITEANVWREIVNANPEERGNYNANSLTDYIDLVVTHFNKLIKDVDQDDIMESAEIIVELVQLMEDYMEMCGPMENVRVQGNGMYLPSESEDVKFLDGTKGISGEYAGFTIDMLPSYHDALYKDNGERVLRPTLCIVLDEYREYTSSDISLESNGDSVSIPLIGQDLSVTRS